MKLPELTRKRILTVDGRCEKGGKLESNFPKMPAKIRDQLRSGGFGAAPRASLLATNLKLLDAAASAFAGQNFEANDWRSFVEFDICHSLPVVALPASGTGNCTAFHPATLAASYRDLLHQQVNLEHLVKHHDPDRITHDRIIGCVVGVSFPPEPEGGWKVPFDKGSAIPIHCCAVVFKIAQGALEMLNEHVSGERKWSVSIEVMGRSIEEMGIYRPSTRELFPIMDAPDLLFEAISKNEDGKLCLGKMRTGEQLALAYGGEGHRVIFQGVGFTGTPASLEAEITAVQLSRKNGEAPNSKLQAPKEEIGKIITAPNGVCAVRMSSADGALARMAAGKRFPGSTVLSVTEEGKAQLPGRFWYVAATAEDPVATIRLRSGATILKKMSELSF